jgi:hypothetical protein
MKTIALGDTHGRTTWKTIIANNIFDKIIFVGDYFDSHDDINSEQQINNFNEIITYKQQNLNKVVLLLGNHDYHYLAAVKESYSSYQHNQRKAFQSILQLAVDNDLIKMCCIEGNLLFSHAGFTKTWCKNNLENDYISDPLMFQQSVNSLLKTNIKAFGFTMGDNCSHTGDDVTQSPIWVRPRSLFIDKIDNYIQIVGHTIMYNIDINNDVVFIDTLGTSGEYLEITDEKIKILK